MQQRMKPRPPISGNSRPGGPTGRRKMVPGPEKRVNKKLKEEITKKVTRNCIVNAVVNNMQTIAARNERLGKAKKIKTGREILAAMDLQELHIERTAVARMGFLDKAEELDKMIEAERTRLKKERDQQDQTALEQGMGGLQMSHTRRTAAMEAAQAIQITAFQEKCSAEIDDLKQKQKIEYDILINEAATKATGGVSSCVCTDSFRCRHNKSASFNTRKPTKEVIRLRQNGQRLRISGRHREADECDSMAAAIEAQAEVHWRKSVEESILSSAWCGGKSRLEQMLERQQATLRALQITHSEKMARFAHHHSLQKRNLVSTLAAERNKVIFNCRKEAIKRRGTDHGEGANGTRRFNADKSNVLQKSSKNICKGSDERDKEIDSDEGGLKGRKTPTAAGVDSSKSLSSYEKSASGKIHRKLSDENFRADKSGDGSQLKTSGSRAMVAYRIKQTEAIAAFDLTRGEAEDEKGITTKERSDNDSNDKVKDENANEDEGDGEDEDDVSGPGKGVPSAHSGEFGRGSRGFPLRRPSTGSCSAPSEPMESPFSAGGFGGSPGGQPKKIPSSVSKPIASPYFTGSLGVSPSGRLSPTGPLHQPISSDFSTGSFGGTSGGPLTPAGPPREPKANLFRAGGFGRPLGGSSILTDPSNRPVASPSPAKAFDRPPGGPSIPASSSSRPTTRPFSAGGFGGHRGRQLGGSPGPTRGPMKRPFSAGYFDRPLVGSSLAAPNFRGVASTSANPKRSLHMAAGLGQGRSPKGLVFLGSPRRPVANYFLTGCFGGLPGAPPRGPPSKKMPGPSSPRRGPTTDTFSSGGFGTAPGMVSYTSCSYLVGVSPFRGSLTSSLSAGSLGGPRGAPATGPSGKSQRESSRPPWGVPLKKEGGNDERFGGEEENEKEETEDDNDDGVEEQEKKEEQQEHKIKRCSDEHCSVHAGSSSEEGPMQNYKNGTAGNSILAGNKRCGGDDGDQPQAGAESEEKGEEEKEEEEKNEWEEREYTYAEDRRGDSQAKKDKTYGNENIGTHRAPKSGGEPQLPDDDGKKSKITPLLSHKEDDGDDKGLVDMEVEVEMQEGNEEQEEEKEEREEKEGQQEKEEEEEKEEEQDEDDSEDTATPGDNGKGNDDGRSSGDGVEGLATDEVGRLTERGRGLVKGRKVANEKGEGNIEGEYNHNDDDDDQGDKDRLPNEQNRESKPTTSVETLTIEDPSLEKSADNVSEVETDDELREVQKRDLNDGCKSVPDSPGPTSGSPAAVKTGGSEIVDTLDDSNSITQGTGRDDTEACRRNEEFGDEDTGGDDSSEGCGAKPGEPPVARANHLDAVNVAALSPERPNLAGGSVDDFTERSTPPPEQAGQGNGTPNETLEDEPGITERTDICLPGRIVVIPEPTEEIKNLDQERNEGGKCSTNSQRPVGDLKIKKKTPHATIALYFSDVNHIDYGTSDVSVEMAGTVSKGKAETCIAAVAFDGNILTSRKGEKNETEASSASAEVAIAGTDEAWCSEGQGSEPKEGQHSAVYGPNLETSKKTPSSKELESDDGDADGVFNTLGCDELQSVEVRDIDRASNEVSNYMARPAEEAMPPPPDSTTIAALEPVDNKNRPQAGNGEEIDDKYQSTENRTAKTVDGTVFKPSTRALSPNKPQSGDRGTGDIFITFRSDESQPVEECDIDKGPSGVSGQKQRAKPCLAASLTVVVRKEKEEGHAEADEGDDQSAMGSSYGPDEELTLRVFTSVDMQGDFAHGNFNTAVCTEGRNYGKLKECRHCGESPDFAVKERRQLKFGDETTGIGVAGLCKGQQESDGQGKRKMYRVDGRHRERTEPEVQVDQLNGSEVSKTIAKSSEYQYLNLEVKYDSHENRDVTGNINVDCGEGEARQNERDIFQFNRTQELTTDSGSDEEIQLILQEKATEEGLYTGEEDEIIRIVVKLVERLDADLSLASFDMFNNDESHGGVHFNTSPYHFPGDR